MIPTTTPTRFSPPARPMRAEAVLLAGAAICLPPGLILLTMLSPVDPDFHQKWILGMIFCAAVVLQSFASAAVQVYRRW